MHTASVAIAGERHTGQEKSRAFREVAPGRMSWHNQFAVAALLLLTLGIGYFAFERFQTDPARTIPAPAVLQSGDDLTNHPVIGLWRLVDDPVDQGGDGFGVFHAGGTYTEVNVGVTFVGIWRLTGENEIEVLSITPDPNSAGTEQYYQSFTYDPATDTLSGYYVPTIVNADGEVAYTDVEWTETGTRLTFESNTNTKPATPEP